MIQLKKQINKKTDLTFYFILLVLSLSFIFLCGYSLLILRSKKENLKKEIKKEKEELMILGEKKERLEKQIEKKEVFLEEEIRKQGYVKEGEYPIIIVRPTGFIEKEEEKIKEKEKNIFNKLEDFLKANILRW